MDPNGWWHDNASAIQSTCAILGILGLFWYCVLTQQIRKSAVAQQEAAQAPMLMFFQVRVKTSWAMKNYGLGPAVNVWWKPSANNEAGQAWYDLGALAAGDKSNLPHHSRPKDSHLAEMYVEGARIHYSDMAGNHYATSGEWKDNAFKQDWVKIKRGARTEFKKEASVAYALARTFVTFVANVRRFRG